MLSSISSSDLKPHWARCWVALLTMVLVTLSSYEWWLKFNSYTPSIESNKDLWSYYRAQVQNNPNALVILGASRAQLGLHIETIQNAYPDKEVVELTINGQAPMATLQSLADDQTFNGQVWLSIVAQSLEPIYWDMQAANNDFFNNKSSLYRRFDAYVTAWIRSKFRFFSPELSLRKIIEGWFGAGVFPRPFYVVGHLDLSKSGDYSKVDTQVLRRHFVEQKRQNYVDQPPMSVEIWRRQVNKMMRYVNQIRSRGGDVILIRMPTDHGHWALDEQAYPKELYWDLISQQNDIQTIHFKDWPALSHFNLPDSSHLDQKDAMVYTQNLLKVFNYH